MAADPIDSDFSLTPDPSLAETRPGGANLAVLAQYLKDLSFEVPHAPEILKHAARVPQGVVSVNITANRHPDEGRSLYETVLKMRVEARLEDRVAYIVELHYGAIVRFENVKPAEIEPALMVKVPRLLFPFARQIVAHTVQAGGFRAMLVNPVDFKLHYEEQLRARGVQRRGLADTEPSGSA
jgi:preprotein translocase subunit SecB